jgi:ABC-type antimicrobial peptide transport system permease subunit
MTFQDLVDGSFNSSRLIAQLTTVYGILALILASIRLYGVAAYTVARSTSEIGIRMALGAQRASVIGMVLRGAMQPITLGLLVGVPVALAGTHAIASQLFGVEGLRPAGASRSSGRAGRCRGPGRYPSRTPRGLYRSHPRSANGIGHRTGQWPRTSGARTEGTATPRFFQSISSKASVPPQTFPCAKAPGPSSISSAMLTSAQIMI